MLTSREVVQSRAAMTPFISTPAAATIIISRGCTCTGSLRRWIGRNGDPDGDQNQRQCVEKRSQDAGALITKGLLICGRPSLEVHRDKRKQQRQKVGYVMPGLGDQGKRMSTYPGDEGKRHVGQRRQQRDA